VEDIRRIARVASEHGLNGIALDGGLDRMDLQPPEYLQRLEQVNRIAKQYSMDIVPVVFSAGYGTSVIAHNRNLAEGLPVREALFVAAGQQARLVPDPPVSLANGGFEEHEGDRLKGYRKQTAPGRTSFVDTSVFHSGAASLRFDNTGQEPVAVMQVVPVHPRRSYRLTFWVQTRDFAPVKAFWVQILAPDGRALGPSDPRISSPSSDWRMASLGFNSGMAESVKIVLRVSGAPSGRIWIDDMQVNEVGLVNVLRRPGTPVTVRDEKSGAGYEEGKDYAPILDPNLNFRFDHDGQPIRILPDSRIRDGQRLRVSYYHGMAIDKGQVTVCMSEPELYAIWERQARQIRERLAPRYWFLDMDEIRAGGTCEACRGRNLSLARILGECITRQRGMIKAIDPRAEVAIWSDMLDPNHNARRDYYLAEGDYSGSWNYIPNDLRIVCWLHGKRTASLAHFSRHGFPTIAGAYYDAETLEDSEGWLKALDKTPGAVGIMYTTWQDKYGLMAQFGDLVSKRTRGTSVAPTITGEGK
jgi:hypothetical protein